MRDKDTWLADALAALIDAVHGAGSVSEVGQVAAAQMVAATGADVAAVVLDESVLACAGPHAADVEGAGILAATTAGPSAEVAGLGRCDVAVDTPSDSSALRLVLLRRQGAISRRERSYLALASRVLTVAVELLASLAAERSEREQRGQESDEHRRLLGSLLKRQQLLDNLGRIERSITARIPLGEVLNTITEAAYQLLGDDLVALRLLDPDNPGQLIVVSDSGVSPELLNQIRRTPVGAGAGGRAVSEDALIVVEHDGGDPSDIEAFAGAGVKAAIAAPVHESGIVVGSLTIATFDPARRFGAIEQESLLAFAEHVSLALTDARTLEAMHAAEHVKNNLLAMVSHELKTPLTVMLGVVQTIQRHSAELPDDLRDEMLASAQERGHELGRLIDRLLEGAQETTDESLQDASLPAVISAVVAQYAGTGQQLLIPPVRPQPLRVDVDKLHGALTNLVEIAVRNSAQRTPVVIETDVAAGQVVVTVTGHGELPPELDLSVFLERSAPASASSLGLGVYLASHLASAIGGTVSIRSGSGTVAYTLRFPAGAQTATAKRTRPVVLP